MTPKLLLASAALATALSAQASVTLSDATTTYTQNFDSLASSGASIAWVDDSTLAGWSLVAAAPVTTYNTGNGSNGSTAGFFSFGATGSAERALGAVVTNGFAGNGGTVYSVLSLTNGSGAAFSGFTLKYDGEQWRNNGNAAAQSLVVQYAFGASYASIASGDWVTAGSAFNFTSPVIGATAAIVDGNVAGKVANIGGSVTTDWSAGSTLWIRWADLNDSGNDHLLAIDNVSVSAVSAVPEPGAYAMLLAGLGAVGFVARRRRG
ncbi:MAG: PEP-CTERM sorting domain-containing protein [Roseateles sp.]|nr:MAG: PEP-CTERM sorting domain-containing protein [Roseateles sp.]